MQSGILLLDKPAGPSSAQALSKVRRKLDIEKIGHSGTLDPFATGLLICLVGKATRLASYAESGLKEYTGTFELGKVTSSDDITGEVLTSSDSIPTFSLIEEAVKNFVGEIVQVPPKVSAVKVDGKRAYDLARKGIDVELKSRIVNVHSFEIAEVDSRRISFKVVCSKGTYIRSLARDLGELLGCGGCVETLRRTGSHPFRIESAHSLEELTLDHLLPWNLLLPQVPGIKTELFSRLLIGDERALHAFVKEVPEGLDRVIYQNPESGLSLGLLAKDSENDTWGFALNVGE